MRKDSTINFKRDSGIKLLIIAYDTKFNDTLKESIEDDSELLCGPFMWYCDSYKMLGK